jgi:signal transduction histidine kinase
MLKTISFAAAFAAMVLAAAPAAAGTNATKAEAIALAGKAVAYIKANGPAKAYAQFAKPDGGFRDRDLYVLVYDLNGTCLAHGTNPKRAGKNNLDDQDADGVFYVRDRMTLAKTKPAFWQDYKYTDPVTKKIEPKSTYCEKLSQTVVCVGIYK